MSREGTELPSRVQKPDPARSGALVDSEQVAWVDTH